MYNPVNSTFSKTYNPCARQNALSDIKRLLTSRDTAVQNKACEILIEVIGRYSKKSRERSQLVEYLLENDITVFLCEAASNLDSSLFRSILSCFRLLWRERRFFTEEHAAHACAAVVRALAQYAGSNCNTAVDACLNFLCDLLNGIAVQHSTSPLSHQSAYSAEQLLACMNSLASHSNMNSKLSLSSALVLHALIAYQPENLAIRGYTASCLVEVLNKWLSLLIEVLKHTSLVGSEGFGMFFVVVCQMGISALSLIKCFRNQNKTDFVQTILADEQESELLNKCALQMTNCIRHVMLELVILTKENETQIPTEEYSVFLIFLLDFFYGNANTEQLTDFCDMLFAKGYLIMLPKVQMIRNDTAVRKVSTLILGEMLKVLSNKYLNVEDSGTCDSFHRVIHTGLVELQHGIEIPDKIGCQLMKSQPYSLLIYIYFYCQSAENPEEVMAPLLPYLVEHILHLPRAFKPPSYIIKALWLVFAMSAISNSELGSLNERVCLEKATNSLVNMFQAEPSIYYTHNPAILLWAFTSQRIPTFIRLQVLSQWLKLEDSLPIELTNKQIVWELLLNVLIEIRNETIVMNCMAALHLCLEDGDDDSRREFASLIWSMLPKVLSKALVDADCEFDMNLCYLLDLATTLIPLELDQTICLKTAVLITILYSKSNPEQSEECRNQYEYVSLKLSLYLLVLSFNQNDNRVLLSFINRSGYLPSVLAATNSNDDRVACAALQLLSYVVYYYAKNSYQPKSVLQIQTHLIIKSLRRDSSNERGASLLQLIYMVLNSGINTPLVLTNNVDVEYSMVQQCNALRALMFRIQLMLCCRDSETQSTAGWKTLNSIFKHAIVFKNDPNLVAILTSQPWTNILIQFQLTQNVSEEFLSFVQNWLTLMQIIIKKCQEINKKAMCKQSLVTKTMLIIKKNVIVDEEMKETKEKILIKVKEILDESEIRFI